MNSFQKEAVTHTDGPMLIVAGAGTGKTFTLVEKIKYLIKDKGIKPEAILCLTFTEKAAYEMEARVDEAMPYGYFQMWISTFHAFADEILKKELSHIGLNPAFTLMTQAQTVVFFRKNLFRFELKYFRPLSNPHKFIEGLLQHFSRLRDEDVSPEEYLKWATKQQKNKELLPEEKMKHLELAKAYSLYQKLKVEKDVMDFDDLIFYLLKLFRTREAILKEYQKQFSHVMVDEFQDTNIAQYQLIKLLCPSKNKPNLTVVGDDSQAIYKFRGASVSNIMAFMEDYKGAYQVTLLDNYRSNQSILDRSYKLIQNNNPDTLEARLGISKELKGHKKNIKDCVQFAYFEHSDQEAEWISETILKTKEKYAYEFRDFAILVRAHSQSEPIIAALQREGIPFQFLGPGTLFKQPEIKDLVAYLKLLITLDDNVCLYRVLSMDLFKLEQEDLILLLGFAKKTSLSLYQAIEIYLSFFHEEWYRPENQNYRKHLPLLREDTRDKLIEIMAMMKKHIKRIDSDNAGRILYSFLEDTGYIQTIANYKTEAEEKRALNIMKFFNLLKSFQNNQEDSTVFSVVDYIEMSMELGESPIAIDTDVALANAVNILTVHSSKGLEFPVVMLSSLVAGRFPTYERREAIPIPNELIKEQLPEGDFHLQEERRLFYVALTRAQERLFLSGSEIYGDGKRKRKISPFVMETLGPEILEQRQARKLAEKAQLSIFDFKQLDPPAVQTKHTISQLSYSQLETYMRCPLQYKYQYVLKIPTPSGNAASFGTTIHTVLQKFYEGFMKDRSYGLSHLLNLLETHWDPVGYGSQVHQKRMKEEGKNLLTEFFNTYHHPDHEILNLEKLFKIKVDDGLYLTGKIDRVDTHAGGSIEIIDYKTGKIPSEKELKKSLQLSIYALAATDGGLYKKELDKVDLTFYYLQGMEKVTMKRTPEELIEVKSTVGAIVSKIREGKFEPHVGPWCDFCNFRMICEAWQ
jgi:DNA helicase-2/ATP-dependent DNA helicase PcrA